ncbi:hypothetical protein ACQP0C_02475 [Nocardia sp. CA-129566]|uniref:hypothetical protein n=1 Tax=Nocardia sp. CA-129566 TaxID=3239976 RepID=UPI003D9903BE
MTYRLVRALGSTDTKAPRGQPGRLCQCVELLPGVAGAHFAVSVSACRRGFQWVLRRLAEGLSDGPAGKLVIDTPTADGCRCLTEISRDYLTHEMLSEELVSSLLYTPVRGLSHNYWFANLI